PCDGDDLLRPRAQIQSQGRPAFTPRSLRGHPAQAEERMDHHRARLAANGNSPRETPAKKAHRGRPDEAHPVPDGLRRFTTRRGGRRSGTPAPGKCRMTTTDAGSEGSRRAGSDGATYRSIPVFVSTLRPGV